MRAFFWHRAPKLTHSSQPYTQAVSYPYIHVSVTIIIIQQFKVSSPYHFLIREKNMYKLQQYKKSQNGSCEMKLRTLDDPLNLMSI